MYCLRCGSPLALSFVEGRDRFHCLACGYIHYENPVPGVGVLIEHDGQLVVIRRGHEPHTGEWALPSGFIEADETVEQAAVREAFEETSLDIELIELFGVHSFPEGPPRSGIIVFYRARPLDIHRMQSGDDASEVQLFRPDELPPLCFRTHREAVDRWLVTHAFETSSRLRPTTD